MNNYGFFTDNITTKKCNLFIARLIEYCFAANITYLNQDSLCRNTFEL